MACPIVGVPFKTFFAATAIGFIPVNIVLVSTGMTLSEISSVGFNPKVIIYSNDVAISYNPIPIENRMIFNKNLNQFINLITPF